MYIHAVESFRMHCNMTLLCSRAYSTQTDSNCFIPHCPTTSLCILKESLMNIALNVRSKKCKQDLFTFFVLGRK